MFFTLPRLNVPWSLPINYGWSVSSEPEFPPCLSKKQHDLEVYSEFTPHQHYSHNSGSSGLEASRLHSQSHQSFFTTFPTGYLAPPFRGDNGKRETRRSSIRLTQISMSSIFALFLPEVKPLQISPGIFPRSFTFLSSLRGLKTSRNSTFLNPSSMRMRNQGNFLDPSSLLQKYGINCDKVREIVFTSWYRRNPALRE
jgi:hypothetical protein